MRNRDGHTHADHHRKHGFFKKKKKKPCEQTQTVNVQVTVNEKDDDDSPVKGCFKLLCGIGKKAAM